MTRTNVNAEDYFTERQKKTDLADRRPVIRKPVDLVGPGIAANAIRITNYSDLLATYNGFFSSSPGAVSAPNADDSFTGVVTSDAVLGGTQTFTSLDSGDTYQRTFTRSPLDSSALYWSDWEDSGAAGDRLTAIEALNIGPRLTSVEGRVQTPLYSGEALFFATSIASQAIFTGTIPFPDGAFTSPPAAWAIKGAPVSGASLTIVTAVDQITTTGCRITMLNTGNSPATFTDQPVRWFAQAHL